MDSRRLSLRAIQPGHVRTFLRSEEAFDFVAQRFNGFDDLEVRRKPPTLSRFYVEEGETHLYGLQPDEEICHVPSGRRLFFEVKNQGPNGNAEERAYRHHTRTFEGRISAMFHLDYHPYFTIFTGNLATDDRYTLKIRHQIEKDHYFLWRDYESADGLNELQEYLTGIVNRYLLRNA